MHLVGSQQRQLLSPFPDLTFLSSFLPLRSILLLLAGFKESENFAGTNLVVSADLVRDLIIGLVQEGGKVDQNRTA